MTDFLPESYLFVYGSLRQAAKRSQHTLMRRYCQWQGEGFIKARLYQIADYPGAVESDLDTDRVYGEIYQISDPMALFAYLDHYEECSPDFPQPHEYRRQQLKVSQLPDLTLTAWVYLYNHGVGDKSRILSGDFLDCLTAE